MITVGISKIKDPHNNNERPCKYSDVPTDPHGWILDSSYKPIPFDLMFLKIENSPKSKSGWWTGHCWTGLRLKQFERVMFWKRNQEYERF